MSSVEERLLAAEDVIRAAKGAQSTARTAPMIERYEERYGSVEPRRSELRFDCGCVLLAPLPAELLEIGRVLLEDTVCPLHHDAEVVAVVDAGRGCPHRVLDRG